MQSCNNCVLQTVEVFESSSAAAACIRAARDIEAAIPEVASRCGLPAEQLVMRFGLHWGATIYMGNIDTLRRCEATASGDEVNAASRIDACATGGLILASEPLFEHLTDDDATALATAWIGWGQRGRVWPSICTSTNERAGRFS